MSDGVFIVDESVLFGVCSGVVQEHVMLNSLLNGIIAQGQELLGCWDGVARKAFVPAWDHWCDGAGKVVVLLGKMGDDLASFRESTAVEVAQESAEISEGFGDFRW